MKLVDGKKRCTKAYEVIDRINNAALAEYYKIFNKIEKERKTGKVVSSYMERAWADKYCVVPYSVNRNNISFLITEEKREVIFVFNKEYNIENIYIKNY